MQGVIRIEKRHLAFFGLILLLLEPIWAQGFDRVPTTDPRDRVVQPGEVTVEEAMRSAESFLSKVGLPTPTGKPKVTRFETDPFEPAWRIVYGGDYVFWVGAKTGRITCFESLIPNQRDDSVVRVADGRFDNEVKIVQTGRHLLERLGFPKDMHCTRIKVHADNEPERGNGKEPGVISILFSAMPHGYAHVADENSVVFFLDPYDGSVTGYRSSVGRYDIQSWTANLTLEQAKAIAEPVAKEYRLKEPLRREREFVPAQKSELLYVIPDGS